MTGKNQYPKKLSKDIKIVSLKGKSTLWNLSIQTVAKTKGIKKFFLLLLGMVKKITIKSGLWYKLIFSQFKDYGEFDIAIAFRQCDPCYSFVLQKVTSKTKIGFVHGELTFMNDISTWKKHMTNFDAIAYVSDAVKKQFVKKYPELSNNAYTVYNMFDIKTIKRLAKEKPDIEFDKSKKNIVTVSRIDNLIKQIDWIPHICKKLKELTDIPFCWYVVGNGPGYNMVLELIDKTGTNDVLKLVGETPNPYNLIAQADFTVLPSKTEAYPMVVIESFILGKPIVCTDFPSAFEMIDKNHGIICGQSIKEIAEGVLKVLDKDTLECLTLGVRELPVTNDKALQQLYDVINED